ncbi:MAG: TIM-barrel domain-containing protein, partial [Clostridia bacterium]
MLEINEKNGKLLSIMFKNQIIFEHTPEKPFIKAIKLGLKFSCSHGNFKVKTRYKDILCLDKYTIVDKTTIVFYNESIEVKLVAKEINGGIKFDILASSDDYAYEFNLKGFDNEGIFGGGEQYRQLNQKGTVVKNFVSEHIVVPPIVRKILAGFFHAKYKECKAEKIDTYAPMTTFVSSNLYAIRFEVSTFGVQDFTNPNISKFMYEKCPKSLFYVKEDSYAQIGKTLCSDIPNNEYLPDWAYDGIILGVQGGIQRVSKIALDLINDGAKINGIWCQDWSGKKITATGSQVYWNWEVDNNEYPNLLEEITKLNNKGVHFLGYINPYLIINGPMYNYCKEKGYLILDKNNQVYHVKSTTFSAGMMDLTNPDMVEYLKETIIKKNMLDLG